MSAKKNLWRTLRVNIIMACIIVGVGVAAYRGMWAYYEPRLPSLENIENIHLQEPLKIYTKDSVLMGEFGDERRIPVIFDAIPPLMVKAILAAEDDRFYQHNGVDFKGLVRAFVSYLRTFKFSQGASTITMQFARNFYLSREKTIDRKLKEILLSLKIEKLLPKEKILELYLNKIFLGHRAYGIGAAAKIYYQRPLAELTLAEFATIASLPKAPSVNNPITNPEATLHRRNYILKRMLKLKFIDQAQFDEATAEPNTAKLKKTYIDVEAHYVNDMVRKFMREHYGDQAETHGYRVYTTLDSHLQNHAQAAVRRGLWAYDERHGYQGALKNVPLADYVEQDELESILRKEPVYLSVYPAIVTAVNKREAQIYVRRKGYVQLAWKDIKWARRYINEHRIGRKIKRASDVLKQGDIILVREITRTVTDEEGNTLHVPTWRLADIPHVEGAITAISPQNGAIVALAGGFDYYQSKFNRVTQAKRQPGSNFKPFIYSAALENGFGPASIINDVPLAFRYGRKVWRPQNYNHRFNGPTSFRSALTHSKNMVSIRLLEDITVDAAIEHVVKFGFEGKRIPKNLTIALGTGEITPLELVRGFAVFANGGYLIDPYFVERVETPSGEIIYQANPVVVCKTCQPLLPVGEQVATSEIEDPVVKDIDDIAFTEEDAVLIPEKTKKTVGVAIPRYAPQVITERNAWVMTSILKDVIRRGTARRALVLKRKDIAGKTGTTNDQFDAWFSGFSPDLAVTAWVGFDRPHSLGKKETGGRAALPMWIDFMQEALAGKEEIIPPTPPGLVQIRVAKNTGLRAYSDNPNAMFETFYSEYAPTKYALHQPIATPSGDVISPTVINSSNDELF